MVNYIIQEEETSIIQEEMIKTKNIESLKKNLVMFVVKESENATRSRNSRLNAQTPKSNPNKVSFMYNNVDNSLVSKMNELRIRAHLNKYDTIPRDKPEMGNQVNINRLYF